MMCGIVGYIGKKNAMNVIMTGLEHLEYRGYDSAGIAINTESSLVIEKSVGKLMALKSKLALRPPLSGESGLGHTRWATHGVPSFTNAHPHRYGQVTLVHNGIFENHKAIKLKLKENGHEFYSDTDTEVAAHLLNNFLRDGRDPILALSMLCDTIHGAYSLGIMLESEPDRVYFAKNGSPLIVAAGDGESYFASDQAALVDYQPHYYSLNDLEIGFISREGAHVFDLKGQPQSFSLSPLTAKKENVQKNGHKHFMHKEIFEQPETIDRVLRGRLGPDGINYAGFEIDFDRLLTAKQIQIIACGSAYYAGLIAKSALESMVRVPVSVEIASEYRYRETLTDHETLVIAISQSGETVDTLSALTKAMSLNAMCMSVCNVVGSAIASVCETSLGNLFLNAGPEISVASTKAFVAQVVALRLLTIAIAKKLGKLSREQELTLAEEFKSLRDHISAVLKRDDEIREIATHLINEPRMLYLGRGEYFPVALEGALKMKELSYIAAEGYPAGELKHGPIAIIDPGMPVIVIFGNDNLSVKTASNLQEVKARGAKILSVAPKSVTGVKEESDFYLELGDCSPLLEPILTTIPLQLLAYHLSDLKGIDVDKPRNLAKSVTVE